jgi:hypothetical protein
MLALLLMLHVRRWLLTSQASGVVALGNGSDLYGWQASLLWYFVVATTALRASSTVKRAVVEDARILESGKRSVCSRD